MEEEKSPDENETEIKPKRILTDLQKIQLSNARAKALEMRKLRADERKVERENTKIDTKMSEMEKQKEILKLQQIAMEQKLDVDIKPKEKAKVVKPPPKIPEPPKEETPPPSPKKEETPDPSPPPSPKKEEEQSAFQWVNGRLMYFE